MNSVLDQHQVAEQPHTLVITAAANDDVLPSSVGATPSAGWNAYDVWRKLIKEARDRREGRHFP